MATQLSQAQIDAALATKDPELLSLVQRFLSVEQHPLHSWSPRPDQPDRHDQQSAFMTDKTSRFMVALGGTGSGKSDAAACKVARFLLSEQSPPISDTPVWVVSDTEKTTAEICWPKLQKFIPSDAIARKKNGDPDISWSNEQARHPAFVRLKPWKGSKGNYKIEFKSAHQGRTKFQGVAIMLAWMSEAISDWAIVSEIIGRTREWAESRVIYEQTPLIPQRELEALYQAPSPGWAFYHMNTRCNSHLQPGFIDELLATVPEEMRDTRTWGAFGSYEGVIFKELTNEHFIKPFPIPEDWPKYRGIDFGQHAAAVWLAHDPANEKWYAYRDYYHDYAKAKVALRPSELIRPIQSVPWSGEFCSTTYSDHDPTWIAELRAGGIHCVRARKEPVLGGIELIRKLLMPQKDGRPGLFIFNSCGDLKAQMQAYRWDKEKNAPLKVFDHTVDCLRYVLFSKGAAILPGPIKPLDMKPKERTPVLRAPGSPTRAPRVVSTLPVWRSRRRRSWG
jgi:hypothetical protein